MRRESISQFLEEAIIMIQNKRHDKETLHNISLILEWGSAGEGCSFVSDCSDSK